MLPGKGRLPLVGPAMPSQDAWLGCPRYQSVHTEEVVDMEGVFPSEADRHLVRVYSNHAHQNDGHHIYGGIAENNFWQVRWQLLFIQPGLRYCAPKRAVGWRFVKCLEKEFHGARERHWNADLPMVFMGVIFQTTPGERKAHKICGMITRRLDLW